MLDQHWLIFFIDFNDLPDDDLSVAVAAIAYVGLKRLAPAPVEQHADGLHARGV